MAATAPVPPWLTSPPGGELLPLVLAAGAATFGAHAIADMDDEQKGYALIGVGVAICAVVYGLRAACGKARTGFCLLGSG